MRALGCAVPASSGPADFEVFPENWDAFLAFLELETQWREVMEYEAIAGPFGPVVAPKRRRKDSLPFTEVRALLECLPDIDVNDAFARIRIMERAARRVFMGLADEPEQ